MFDVIGKLFKKKKTTSDYNNIAKTAVSTELQFELDVVKDSKNLIGELVILADIMDGTIYHSRFTEVLEITKKIHERFIDENIPKQKLAQMHLNYTRNFIDTYKDLSKSIMVEEIKLVKEVVEEKVYTIFDASEICRGTQIDFVLGKLGMKKLESHPSISVYDKESGRTKGQNYFHNQLMKKFIPPDLYRRSDIKESNYIGESGKFAVCRKSRCGDYLFLISLSSDKLIYGIDISKEGILGLLNDKSPKEDILDRVLLTIK
jgi:hypothetical protein